MGNDNPYLLGVWKERRRECICVFERLEERLIQKMPIPKELGCTVVCQVLGATWKLEDREKVQMRHLMSRSMIAWDSTLPSPPHTAHMGTLLLPSPP